ncbi:hypothetical protein HELRODRAFT_165844 [Helobdella robusta]|uniref:FAD linked oxidase N-terminal domain-containing protein n=1 Tax=Helobdella robusta TaxID=6412 RepID=T1EXC9_HELRO|nr:hypothetical protein HELRODRAFT_165844 [Helobdella robusta]ESN91772.1 hypothetical protein HELRODRAFT_165844 [Helobdella robusta]
MPPAIDQCTFFLVLLLVGVSRGIEYSRIKVNHNIEITGQDKNRIVSENITMLIESHARITKHYHLPLDQVSKVFEIVNKFGLSAKVVGNGQLVGGVKKNGFLLSETGGITILPGPVEVNECLFNLSYCTEESLLMEQRYPAINILQHTTAVIPTNKEKRFLCKNVHKNSSENAKN